MTFFIAIIYLFNNLTILNKSFMEFFQKKEGIYEYIDIEKNNEIK